MIGSIPDRSTSRDGETDLYAFKQFMFRWVRDHIMDVDRKIGRFLTSFEPES